MYTYVATHLLESDDIATIASYIFMHPFMHALISVDSYVYSLDSYIYS